MRSIILFIVISGAVLLLVRFADYDWGSSGSEPAVSGLPTPRWLPTATPAPPTATAAPLPAPQPASGVPPVLASAPSAVAQPSATMTLVPAHTATTVPESGGVGGFFRSFGDLRDAATNAQPEIDVPALERRVHDLINAQRTSHGLAALAWDGALGDISRAHSTDMAVKDYFEHVNLSGQDASDRGAAVGYDCVKTYPGYYTHGLAENIYLNWLYSSASTMNGVVVSHDWNTQEELAVESVTGWMNSPGHRENILTDSYDRTGIGIAISPNDQVLITQVFC